MPDKNTKDWIVDQNNKRLKKSKKKGIAGLYGFTGKAKELREEVKERAKIDLLIRTWGGSYGY